MRKKLILAVISIIVLSSFVVLGSSPKFIREMLESVQNNQITRVFSPTISETENSGLNRANPVPERPLPSFEQTNPGIPEHVLFDMVFRLDNEFRAKAMAQETAGEIPTAFKYYFKDEAGLTDEENLILKQVAVEFLEEVQPIDAQAQIVIEGGGKVAAVAPTLSDLQEQRNAVVLSNRDKLANRLGGTAFGRFNQYVQEDFALQLNSYQVQPN